MLMMMVIVGRRRSRRYKAMHSVQLRGVTLQFHAAELRNTAKDVLLFLAQHTGTHSHCPMSVRDPSLILTQFCALLIDCVILQSIRNTNIVPM